MFSLVYQCDDFLVIDKHPGISVHKDDNEQPLLAEVARQTGDSQLYLIHRLDKMTSGLLLLGRHAKAASQLSALFAERTVEKYYLAVSARKPSKKQGTVAGDMARSRRAGWKLLPTKDNPATTQFFSAAANQGQRQFLCKPYTGKTHQIRVALKSVGSAILGDSIYGGEASDRGYLHAYALRFTHEGETRQFICPPQLGDNWPAIPDNWLAPGELTWPKVAGKRSK